MSTPEPVPAETLLSLAQNLGDNAVGPMARAAASVMADPRSLPADRRPVSMGRRQATVTAVNLGPPLTADVDLNGVTVPGASPQATYRPQVDDIVWLEFMGTDAHISPPLTTRDNRRWNLLALAGSWVTYAGNDPKYWRDMQGMVVFQGTMASGANGIFATLPTGYWPAVDHGYSVPVSDGSTWQHGLVAVRSATGNLEFIGPATAVEVFLDGVHFRID